MSQTEFIPLLPIRNAVIFPRATMPIVIGRQRSVIAIKKAQAGDGLIVLATQVSSTVDNPNQQEIYKIGTLCRANSLISTGDGAYQAVVTGLSRFKINEFKTTPDYFEVKGENMVDLVGDDPIQLKALLNSLKDAAIEVLNLFPGTGESISKTIQKVADGGQLADMVASYLNIPISQKQKILENVNVLSRLETLLDLVRKEREVLLLQKDIKDRMAERLNKAQKHALLREQLKAIREELGDTDYASKDNLSKRIDDANMPEEAYKSAQNELRRLEGMPSASAEYHVIVNYLDWLCSMPWDKKTEDIIDLKRSRKILDTDHYGLDQVKKRIIQHLAVAKLKNDVSGTILCLVGAPGVGKTSLGQSVAKSLGRKFVRVSLGGLRDDSEVRGHRRTYIGAMPGRLIQGIKRAGVNNPLIMLDEIDKMGMSIHGDPASALLEILDSEQNNNFVDHFLDVPFDLSNCFFICTANITDPIPPPLRDRMEMINLSGYTTNEKLQIAQKHLVPKQLKDNGLKPEQIELDVKAIDKIIVNYTREAGVRGLERRIAEVFRSCAEKIVEGEELPIRLDPESISEILGPEAFLPDVLERKVRAGIATGLAWTAHGGDILFIEASQMPGTNQLRLTGQLGDVMKESAQIAMSLLKSNASRMTLSDLQHTTFEKLDFHIHVPAGAIPKDGPSAGVTMLLALVSLATGQVLDPQVGMTGEITLRGTVLPVGGIKEKLIAAHRAGVKKILLPKLNKKDLVDVPDEVKSQFDFQFIETIEEAIEKGLGIKLSETPQLPSVASDPSTSGLGVGIS